ncbi:MAG: helix-turn-helix transcriptional regulator [Candidatus Tritonobacter lacicola]|nr:helix-turn-helix transcriptional regulator [Candidatus Tritonobacter lacicola]
MSFGRMVKELRIKQGKTLRQFCLENGHDPSNWSKIEREVNTPPKNDEVLMQWAHQLGIEEGTDEWILFIDEACIARKQIPQDLLSDHKIAEKLPVFFRTIRGTELTDESLDDFIEKVRELHRPDSD